MREDRGLGPKASSRIKVHEGHLFISTFCTDSRSDSVRFTIGLVSWLMALFNFIIDETFTLSSYLEEQGGESTNVSDLINQKSKLQNHAIDFQDAN